jgi:hypothetical protein
MQGAIYIKDSKNGKIGGSSKVDATMTSIDATCSPRCPLKDNGCYAQLGNSGIHASRLDREAEELSSLSVAKAEAAAIDSAYEGKDFPAGRNLRLHVSGDCRTKTAAKIVNAAVGRWKNRGGNKAWSYTHSWKEVPRSAYTHVSMLASVSNVTEANEAVSAGYVPAIVVDSFESEKAFRLNNCEVSFIPCPAQTFDNVDCQSCKLCMNDDKLRSSGKGIAFSVHGAKSNSIKKFLNVLK